MKKSRSYIVALHVLIWLVFIILPISVLPVPPKLFMQSKSFYIMYSMGSVFSVIAFYFNYSYAIPKFLFTKRYVRYFLAVLVFFLVLVIFSGISMYFFYDDIGQYRPYTDDIGERPPAGPLFIGGFLQKVIIVFITSYGFRFYKKYKNTENEKTIAELDALKSQINPHFLFNTLNGIYGLAITQSEQTAESISKLSSIMRYVITETQADKVTVEKEVNYIQNYIALQKIRLTRKTRVTFTHSGDIKNNTISPVLLITFVENAFKYGVSTELETEIVITLNVVDRTLYFFARNNKVKRVSKRMESNNIGIKNTRKRLDLIYNNRYTLNIRETDTTYIAELKINLS